MTGSPISANIQEEAADWVMRLEEGPLSAADDAAFRNWRQIDPLHEQALARLGSLWRELDEVDLPETLRRVHNPGPVRRLRVSGRRAAQGRKAWHRSAIAAGVAFAALLGSQYGSISLILRADHVTDVGERRAISLSDGSRIDLDSDSAVAIDYTRDHRSIRLLSGRAAFTVARNPQRPFVVAANGGTTTALGTAFIVQRSDEGAHVVVTEHSVAAQGGSAQSRVIPQGMAANYGPTGVEAPMPADLAHEAAWTRGKLVVIGRPLREVVAEIARYRRGWIGVSGDIADMRVSGVFDLDQPLEAITALQTTLALKSYRLTDRLILLRK